jgi:hypothetical protein
MKKTIIALLFMFSIVLVGCDDTSIPDDNPDFVEGLELEEDMDDTPDPGPDAEDNATDGDG